MILKKNTQYALISVSDTTGIIDFSQELLKKNIRIISTGGTAKYLQNHNINVIEIAEYIGFPEIMNGQIKTLHPKIYAGILAKPNLDNKILKKYKIYEINIVVINFYPFKKNTCMTKTIQESLKYIDIGGPAMIRASIKNYPNKIIIVDPNDYKKIILEIKKNDINISIHKKFQLAKKALKYILTYDTYILNYFNKSKNNKQKNLEQTNLNLFKKNLLMTFIKKQTLRYGENKHQRSAFYTEKKMLPGSISSIKQIQGKPLSYNNIYDSDIALECVKQFEEPTCVIVKHGNPCGVATRDTLLKAYNSAYNSDTTSAFGGIIALNKKLDKKTAITILEKQFVEVIITPDICQEAITVIKKKPNIRMLVSGYWKHDLIQHANFNFRSVTNGLLVQENDSIELNSLLKNLKIVTNKQPTVKELKNAIFAWKIVRFIKSNAIVYVKNLKTISIGSGQTSRIYSCKIANIKAQDAGFIINNSVMASDAFFPFTDSIDHAAKIGISCIIQPGGSIKDQEIIQLANKKNISMIFTNIRQFKH